MKLNTLRVSLVVGASLAASLSFAGSAHAWSSRPAQACKSLSGLPGPYGLWLGHFSGGKRVAVSGVAGVEWRDDYACFTSGAECRAWWNGLNRHYRDVQGHGTCLALRGGGVPVVAQRAVGLRVRY
ncbi:MAG: hypothetical protein JWN93_3186 [Hyphomicrobiales bacterium]|nr:hypothetical protein [Hyphomicrobiales bacterium]